MFNDEDMNQVLRQAKQNVFRDLRVASQGYVVSVSGNTVDVQLTVMDVTGDIEVVPPMVKGLRVVGSSMPAVGDIGIILHLDRKNSVSKDIQRSGGPAHEVGYGVFLPLVQ